MRHDPSVDELIQKGPAVDVTIRPHRLEAHTRQVQQADVVDITARMLIDTGARVSVVSEQILERLGLEPVRMESIFGVSGKAELRPVFRVSLSLELDAGIVQLDWNIVGVTDASVLAHGYDGFLGRDFLRTFRLEYRGYDGTFELVHRDMDGELS